MLAINQFWFVSLIKPIILGFEKTSGYWSVPLSSFVHRQTSYYSGIRRLYLGCMTIQLINPICPGRKQTVLAIPSYNSWVSFAVFPEQSFPDV